MPSARLREVVVFGSRPYDARVPLGDWQLARSFARLGHPVLYVDPPVHVARVRNYRGGTTTRETSPGEPAVARLRPVALGARTPWVLSDPVRVAVGLQVRLWLLRHRWSRPVVITVAPERGVPRLPAAATLVYWQKDRQWASRTYPRPEWLGRQHRELLAAADVATGVSPEIVADGASLDQVVHWLPNGVELEHFRAPMPEPACYTPLPRPRVVFVGAWGWRVDKELFATLARQRPQWTFVTVGSTRDEPVQLPNVVNLGPRDYAQLPAYLQHADVGIVPYRDEPFNAASAPLKIVEYVAAGLPVVASGVLRGGAVTGTVYADTLDDWLTALDAAVGAQRGADLAAAVAEHRWEDRSRRLLELVDEHEARRGAADSTV